MDERPNDTKGKKDARDDVSGKLKINNKDWSETELLLDGGVVWILWGMRVNVCVVAGNTKNKNIFQIQYGRVDCNYVGSMSEREIDKSWDRIGGLLLAMDRIYE